MFTTQKDIEFNTIKNLSWLPWVGSDFFRNDRRLLIIGESHYVNGETMEDYQKSLSYLSQINFTRNLIIETQIDDLYSHKALDNLFKTLFGNKIINKHKVWQNIAFYNFVQRTMNYGLGNQEIPNITDFDNGWKTFIDVVKIIKPTDCIFIGVTAATSFERMMDQMNISRTARIYHPKIGNTAPALASINIDDNEVQITFIKHTSAFFSPKKWQPFLKLQNGEIMKKLENF